AQILAHMGDLFDWALSIAQGKQTWHDSTPLAWNAEIERFFATVKKFDDRLAGAELLHGSVEGLFQGPVADALNHVGQVAMLRRPRDVSDFCAVQSQRRSCFRHNLARKRQPHALTVYLAARAHALHDLLSGIAAFGVADVAVLQSRFVGELFFSEVIAKPRHALSEPDCAQCRVSRRPAAVRARLI